MTSTICNEIAAIRRRADRNAHGHIAQALRLKLLDDVATFLSTVGGAAIMGAGALLLNAPQPEREIEIAIAIIGATITLVGVWQAVWQPGRRSQAHKDWAIRFTSIEDDCRLVQCGSSSKNIDDLFEEILEITQQADLVSEFFWRKRKV